MAVGEFEAEGAGGFGPAAPVPACVLPCPPAVARGRSAPGPPVDADEAPLSPNPAACASHPGSPGGAAVAARTGGTPSPLPRPTVSLRKSGAAPPPSAPTSPTGRAAQNASRAYASASSGTAHAMAAQRSESAGAA